MSDSGAVGPVEIPGISPQEMLRYGKQLAIPEVGEAGQRRLKAAKVLVVGAGGLGSPLGLYLTAMGVGRIGIVDHDAVEESNLQRQVLYSVADVGRPKLDAAVSRLAGLNPHVELVSYPERFSRRNAVGLVGDYDVVVDATDNYPSRYLLHDTCAGAGKPGVYGSVSRFVGHVSVFGAPGGPCFRCLFPEPPTAEAEVLCTDSGVIGALPGIIGTFQALEVVKLVMGVGRPLVGRLLSFDGLAGEWLEIQVSRRSMCAICGSDSPPQADDH